MLSNQNFKDECKTDKDCCDGVCMCDKTSQIIFEAEIKFIIGLVNLPAKVIAKTTVKNKNIETITT